jgi:hypothetical protein
LYSVITPLLEPETVATPAEKLTAVDEPNGTGVPELSLTVGTVPPGALLAPENVRLCEPV